MFKDKRIFVSGGNGVIGNYLVEKLHAFGAIILVGDLKPRSDYWSKDIQYRQGDLNYITKEELEAFSPEYFFHLAATFERSDESYEFWEENRRHNLNLSTYLMGILKDIPSLKKVIFASSYLIYDKELYNFKLPAEKATKLKESDPILPRNLTGSAKLNHEIELRFLNQFKKDQFQTVSARIFRSYGKYSRDIISRWIRSLLNNEEIQVYKKEGIFDYVFAEDVAEGLIRLSLSEKAQGVVNLGRGNARKVSEVLEVLKKHFPSMKYREVEIEMPYEASEADVSLLRSITAWRPEQDIETTIPKLIEFEKKAIASSQIENKELSHFGILVTSISKKVPLLKAVRNAINKSGGSITLHGGDGNEECIGKYFVDQFWKMPRTVLENKSEIIGYIKKHNIKAIVPSRDGELIFWSNLQEELKGVSIMVSKSKAVENCLDKIKFYEVLRNDFPVIPTYSTMENGVEGLFVVKEQFGAGSANIGIGLDKNASVEFSKKMEYPIFQPYIKGKEYSIDVYISRNGKAKGAVVRSRELVVNGESQITTIVQKPALLELSLKLVEKLELYGHIVLQVLENDKGFHIIECNSRFGGASTLSVSAGLDSFYWFLLEGMGADVNEYSFIPTSTVKKQIRFPEDIVV
jgi:carbamoyl-phosphate synthase large subunit